MIPSSSVSGDKCRVCPYDVTHVILAKSFDAHLFKCRKNHKGHKTVVCPLDHTHIIPKPELNHHLSQCDKRSLMDRELQKQAGENGLRGDVVGPPIVADHLAGKDFEEGENWDEVPTRSVPTPALFNEKIKNTPQDSYGIIPGGGYAPPPAEPKIRKIPNAPAMAATLSNPAAAQIRPSRNQVFEFSVGMPRSDGYASRHPTPLRAPTTPGMTGVRAPVMDQGPRFIGRGISKFATKSNQAHTVPIAQSAPDRNRRDSPSPKQLPSSSKQFGDVTSSNVCTSHSKDIQNASKNVHQLHSAEEKGEKDSEDSLAAGLKNQQFVLLHQKQQLDQLKQHHTYQQLELAKKHQLQELQLQKLQGEEKKQMLEEQEKQELELSAKIQALHHYFQNSATSLSSSSSSSSSSAIQMLSALTPDILAAIGNSFSGILPMGGMQGMGGMATAAQSGIEVEAGETWHESEGASQSKTLLGNEKEVADLMAESLLRLSVQDSGDTDGAADNAKPGEDLVETRSKLEKMLVEVGILEQKFMLGHVLTKDEEAKRNSKDEVMNRLSALPPIKAEKP